MRKLLVGRVRRGILSAPSPPEESMNQVGRAGPELRCDAVILVCYAKGNTLLGMKTQVMPPLALVEVPTDEAARAELIETLLDEGKVLFAGALERLADK